MQRCTTRLDSEANFAVALASRSSILVSTMTRIGLRNCVPANEMGWISRVAGEEKKMYKNVFLVPESQMILLICFPHILVSSLCSFQPSSLQPRSPARPSPTPVLTPKSLALKYLAVPRYPPNARTRSPASTRSDGSAT